MYKINTYLLWIVALFLIPTYTVHATEKPAESKKQTLANLYLTAVEAYKMKQKEGDQLLFIDIRTPSELVFVGRPINIDINIPLVTLDYNHWNKKKKSFKKVPNTEFVSQVAAAIKAKKLSKSSTIILLCRSGSRSSKAANLLTAQGYSKAYTVIDGFEGDKGKIGKSKGKRVVNGWKNSGLPWSYKLDRTLVSLNR